MELLEVEEETDLLKYYQSEIIKAKKDAESKKEETNRVIALSNLYERYSQEEQEKTENFKLLEQLKKQAKEEAQQQKLKTIFVVDKYIRTEQDEKRKNAWITVREEIKEEEEDIQLIQKMQTSQQPAENNTTEFDLKKAERERDAFIASKQRGTVVLIPELKFFLSREDVLFHVIKMNEERQKFSAGAITEQRKKLHLPDCLYCGEWCFGLMYEKNSVLKFILRLDKVFAANLIKNHTAVKTALFPGGENWFSVIIDSSFITKQEVYNILNEAYFFVLNKYYVKENGILKTNTEIARIDRNRINLDILKNVNTADKDYETAIGEFNKSVQKYNAIHKLSFNMSRRRLCSFVRNSNVPKGEVVERENKWYLPASLKSNGKTYAMVYEKNGKLSLTLRLPDDYAENLTFTHPGVCHARFPKAPNWYTVPVDGSFQSPAGIYKILNHAIDFVIKPPKKPNKSDE